MNSLNLSPKEALILELLVNKRDMYGLEMVKAAPDKLKRGTVYVTLSRMADKGYVESRLEKDPGEAGMPRRLFTITGLGQQVLAAWQLRGASLLPEGC
ncbi:hypothetical protein ABI59_05235 [Acidobacteria bacterium Mor1]|nr:hypothetical protein ABI59_05235 [Acidobacteria bacterium Mor1]